MRLSSAILSPLAFLRESAHLSFPYENPDWDNKVYREKNFLCKMSEGKRTVGRTKTRDSLSQYCEQVCCQPSNLS